MLNVIIYLINIKKIAKTYIYKGSKCDKDKCILCESGYYPDNKSCISCKRNEANNETGILNCKNLLSFYFLACKL
jgi:hypothetical protein